MLISEAWAQSAGGIGGAGGLEQFLPFVLVIVVFYFLLIRPQQAKAKKHKELVKNLRRGDRVLTQGGLFGTVSKVITDAELQVEIAEGVRVRVLRTSVTEVLAKTQPLSKDKDSKSSDDATDGDAANADDVANDEQPAPPSAPPAPQGIMGLLSKFLGGK